MHLILDNYDKFVELTNKQLRRRAHRRISQLEAAIGEFIDAHHSNPKPFVWTKTADQILASMARFANVVWTLRPHQLFGKPLEQDTSEYGQRRPSASGKADRNSL